MQKLPPSRFSVINNVLETELTEIPEHVDYQREIGWYDPGNGRRGRGRGTRGRGGRGRGRGGRGLRGIGTSIRADFMEENIGTREKTTRKYTRRGGRARGRGGGRKRGRRSVRPRQRSEGRVTITKGDRFGSFSTIGIGFKQDNYEESPRSSPGNDWGLEEARTPYVEGENISASQSDENGLVSGDEYDDQAENYMIGYGQNRPMGLVDDESDEEEDADGYEEEDDGAQIGHRMMDANVDDEDEEMGDDDDVEDIGVDVNGDEDDYSSEYSD